MAERLGLDKHKLAPTPERRPEEPPTARATPPQPHDRVRFKGFSCLVPPGCPNLEAFKAITEKTIGRCFPNAMAATTALQAYEECLDTKGQFAGYPEAVWRYREARIMASPQAEAWDEFLGEHRAAFADQDEDGKDIEPPIPEWSAANIRFQSNQHERAMLIAEAKSAEQGRGDRGDQERD